MKTNPKDRRQEICQDGRWRWPRPCAATAPGVNTASPLTIKAHDQVISKYLYKSASLSLQAGDEVLVYETGVAFYIIAKVVPV